jgi:hypothetical protein
MDRTENPVALAGANRVGKMMPINDAASLSSKSGPKDQSIVQRQRAFGLDELRALDPSSSKGWKSAGELVYQLVSRLEVGQQEGHGFVKCGECRFFAGHPKSDWEGTCRYSPPAARDGGSNAFPIVRLNAWCRVGQSMREVRP